MSDSTASFTITIPPNTANPQTTKCPLGLSDVQDILVSVPAGCAGNVGFQIWAGGSVAYPLEPSQFFVFDDYVYVQEVSNQIESGQWAIVAFNTDTFPHTLRVYFRYNNIALSPSTSVGLPVGL